MLKRKCLNVVALGLSFILILTSCRNTNLPWRSGHLVAQLYRQYKQEILLAYNDFQTDMVVDEQHGYARAYFDNYRKQMIFTTQGTLDYMINGKQLTTSTEDIGGYVASIEVSDKYQIGIEVMNNQPKKEDGSPFDGLQSRVIDLNTMQSVTVEGLLFNRCLLVGDYLYGFPIGYEEIQFLDIFNVKTMEHKRIKIATEAENEINFMYQSGEHVYAQSSETKKVFLLRGNEMIEQNDAYKESLLLPGGGQEILKDVAPRNSDEHWYIEPGRLDEIIYRVRFIRTYPNAGFSEVWLPFERDDIIRIRDVAHYGKDKVALFLTAKDDDGKVHAIINIFDLRGNKIYDEEITDIRGDIGRFTYLDFVE